MFPISKRAKVVSDKPAYTEKEKSESGGQIYRYDEKHIEKRWHEKCEKLKRLEKSIEKLRTQYNKDLSSDDLRTQAEAAIVGILDDTAQRIGNEDSVKEYKTYGVSTFKVKHLTFSGSKTTFKFVGKDQVKQDVETSNSKITKVLKELVKGKKDDDFVFEIDGVKIWDRAVNRYLNKFDISAKDLRGFQANKIMKEKLKKKDFKEALEETAKEVGHEPATLKNQYLDPALVEKYTKKASISSRAFLTPEDISWLRSIKPSAPATTTTPANLTREGLRINPGVKLNQLILDAWRTLFPFLPAGAILTSGIRTPDDQKRVLRQYWYRAGLNNKHPNYGDYYTMSKILGQKGYIVGPPTTNAQYGHLKSNAIDISGANLNEIAKAIEMVTEHPDLDVKFTKPLVEANNNDVHVGIQAATYDPNAIAKVLQEVKNKNRVASISNNCKIASTKNLTRSDLETIYELEYKLHMLESKGYAGHILQHIEKKLGRLLDKGLRDLKEGFEQRLFAWDVDFKSRVNSLKELYPDTPDEEIEEIAYKKIYLSDPTYQNLKSLYDGLKRAPTGDIKKDTVLFQKALNAMHYTGKMVEYLPEYWSGEITNDILNGLSSGEKYIPKWDAEIKRILAEEQIVMRKLSARYDDNIIKEDVFPYQVRQILNDISESNHSRRDDIIAGELVVSKDPDVSIKWHFLNNKNQPSMSNTKYHAYAYIEEKLEPGYSEQETVFDMSDSDAVALATKMRDYFKDLGFQKDLMDDFIDVMKLEEAEKQEMKSLNVENISQISKMAGEEETKEVIEDLLKSDVPNEIKEEFEQEADDKIKIDIDPDDQKLFDLLKEVKAHYSLNVELRVAGGWVRDSFMKRMENK